MPSSGCKTCARSEEHTSELQSHDNLVCRLLLEKNKLRGARPEPRPRRRALPHWEPTARRRGEGGASEAAGARSKAFGDVGCGKCLFFYEQGAPGDLRIYSDRLLPD